MTFHDVFVGRPGRQDIVLQRALVVGLPWISEGIGHQKNGGFSPSQIEWDHIRWDPPTSYKWNTYDQGEHVTMVDPLPVVLT